jgi:hypothetical protein
VDRAALAFLYSDAVAMASLNLHADPAAMTPGAVTPRVPVPIRPAMHQRRITQGLGRDPQAGRRGQGCRVAARSAETDDQACGCSQNQSFTHAFLQKFFNAISRTHQRNVQLLRSSTPWDFVHKLNNHSWPS